MASYLVQNLTHPVSSVHVAGVHIEPPYDNIPAVLDAFLADHPAAPGDIISVVPYAAFNHFTATNVLQYPSVPAPALAAAGT